MPRAASQPFAYQKITRKTYRIFVFPKREQPYLYLLLALVVICAVVHPYRGIATWVAFMLAGYSAIANDSIQTIGTFISSNRHIRWYYLWLFMGIIFTATITWSWYHYQGDISYQRLAVKGLDTAPDSFNFLQLFSPVVLLVLTRWRMPVSTSILLLSAFSTQVSSIESVLSKSFLGYFMALVAGLFIWWALEKWVIPTWRKKPHKIWSVFQWMSSGLLWSVWIMQDMANIAVVLPRQIPLGGLLFIIAYIVLGLGLLFYLRGDRIQRIVEEKTNLTDVRTASIIDLVYASLLFFLKELSHIPISTTWVFIGLLGGREIGLAMAMDKKKNRKKQLRHGIRLMTKNIWHAGIGLIVSLVLACGINASMRKAFLTLIGL